MIKNNNIGNHLSMDVTEFPFDVQHCYYQMGPFNSDRSIMQLESNNETNLHMLVQHTGVQ